MRAALELVRDSLSQKIDGYFVGAGRSPRVNQPTRKERLDRCAELSALYNRPEYFSLPDTFVGEPAAPVLSLERVRSLKDGAAFDAQWKDGFSALHPELQTQYFSYERNASSHARLLLHDRPRPAIILMHGYLGGVFRYEEYVLAARRWYALGFDVALGVLPFHGRKRIPTERFPLFPNNDSRLAIECCRQAVHDIRTLTSYFLRHGAPRVGIMGMSLGGYISALAATLEPRLTFCSLLIPFASFAELARDRGTLTDGDADFEEFLARRESERSVSPLARPSRVEHAMVIGAKVDLVTPIRHAQMLAHHFNANLHVLEGGHLLQTWRSQAFSLTENWLSTFL